MNYLLANFPALKVINPAAVETEIDFKLDNDKSYCRTSTQMFTIQAFPGDKYEYIRNFYFGEADGEYFCNPDAAMITSSHQKTKVTVGYIIGDVVKVDGKEFILQAAANKNIALIPVQ